MGATYGHELMNTPLLFPVAMPADVREKSDVRVLRNGDRLTCEIKSLDSDTLSISLDYAAGTISINWGKVDHVEGKQLFLVKTPDGLVYSGQLLQDLVEKGMPRDDAYKAVQENAMAAWESDSSFRDRVAQDQRITKYLTPKELDYVFDLNRQLRNVDKIFARVFGAHPAGEKGAVA